MTFVFFMLAFAIGAVTGAVIGWINGHERGEDEAIKTAKRCHADEISVLRNRATKADVAREMMRQELGTEQDAREHLESKLASIRELLDGPPKDCEDYEREAQI